MSASPAAASATSATVVRARWPFAGRGQGIALVGAFLAVVGSLLPWVQTAVASFNGLNGAGLYTFAAAWVGVAGGLLRSRRAAIGHTLVAGVVCAGLPLWQLAHLWSLGLGLPGPGAGWHPGIGLGLVLLGGLLALRGAWYLARGSR